MKNGKKIISFITVFTIFALLIGTLPLGVFASDAIINKVTATTSASVKQGNTGYLYVDIDSLEDVSSLSVSVHYDPEKIEIIQAYNSVGNLVYDSVVDETFVQFSYVFDGNGENAKTRLFYFRYRVLSDATPGDTYFDIVVNDAYNSAYETIDVTGSRCSFEITEQVVNKTCYAYSSSSSISSAINEEFDLTFRLSSSYKIASGAFVINYDSELFEVVSVTNGAFLKDATVDINTDLKGAIYISFIGASGKTSGDFVKVKFKTIKNTNETSLISFSSTDIYDESYDLIYCSGAKTNATVNYDPTYIGDAPDMCLYPEYSYEKQQLTLTIKLDAESHLGAGDFTLTFDKNNFRYNSYVQGVDAFKFSVNDKNAKNGVLRISFISFTDLVDEETFITIVFDTPYFCEDVNAEFDLEAMGLCDSMTNPIMLNLVDGMLDIPTLTGHDIHQYEAKAPTCTDIGWNAYEACSYCDYSTYVELSATGHNIASHNAKEPTCTDIGWNAYEDCSKCDYTTYVEIPANGHSYSVTVKDPTCLTQGYTLHSCSECGDSYIDTYVDALGHDLSNWTQTKAPTCTEKGEEHRYCSRCDYSETREAKELGHSHIAVVTKPTCTEKGYTTHTCPCGDEYVDNYVNALNHDISSWVETKAPTCTEKGEEQRDCSRCDYFETREVAALGHTPSDWIIDLEATFENDGKKHKECLTCQTVVEESVIPMRTHSYVSVVTNPTCTNQGYTTHTCSECGNSYVDDYKNALGHNLGDWTQTKAPDCTNKGEEHRDCSRCDYSETREINATGHSYNEKVTAPTCTERGYTTYTCHCSDSYVDAYVNVLGHDLSDWIQTQPPTCIEKGGERRDCSRCDYHELREVACVAHNYELVVTSPSCTEKGYTSHICTACQDTFVDTYIDELGHKIIEWQETKAPTCTEIGSEMGKCIRCDYSENREVSALGHDIVLHEGKEPTATEEGWKEYETCSRCDHSTFESIPALGTDETDPNPNPEQPITFFDFVKAFFEFVIVVFKFVLGFFGVEI